MCIFLISRKYHLPPGLLLIECESTPRGSLVLASLAITPTELMTTAIPAPRKPDTWLVNHIMWETVMSAQLLEIHEIIHMDIIFRIQTAWINWIMHSNLENHLHICIKHKCHLLTSMVILFHLTNFKFIQVHILKLCWFVFYLDCHRYFSLNICWKFSMAFTKSEH